VAVTEVPLLYESGGEERFDKVVVITAPEGVRRARSQSATDKREQRLIPDREKIAKADFSYVNTGTPEELEQFVRSVMDDLAK
jgi:dephospho-CoA kinase